ncbi:MAG: hypothetical protein AAF747_05030, partial [Planctomycetota bacterium]
MADFGVSASGATLGDARRGSAAGLIAGLVTVCGMAGVASGQLIGQSAVIDITGMELRCPLFGGPGTCFPDQERDSFTTPFPAGPSQALVDAPGYRYELTDATISTTGFIALEVPTGSELIDVLELAQAGAGRLQSGFSRNLTGGPAPQVFTQTFEDTVFNGFLDISITLEFALLPNGAATFKIRDVDIPLGGIVGTITVDEGTVTIDTWDPSPVQETEWRFNGDLDAVEGNALLRYLDDPAFGEILGGGNNVQIGVANPDAPTGVT